MPRWTRRRFMQHCAALASSLALPVSTLEHATQAFHRTPILVSGRVLGGGAPLSGVAVTDGRTVVATDDEGRFSFTATAEQPFVYLSVPAGYRIPTSDVGTARPYVSLDPSGSAFTTQFELEPLETSDERHAFLAVTDPQTETADEMRQFQQEIVPALRGAASDLGEQPLFGVGCGDLMFDDLELFPDYERAVQQTGLPFWQVVGNHDLDFDASTDPGSTATFRRYFGPTYYSFDRGAVHYVVLDDVFWPGSDGYGYGTDDYIGYLDHVQLEWLRQDLDLVEAGRPVIVFTHIPPFSTRFERQGESAPSKRGQIINREALYDLLDPFEAQILSGHVHENEHRFAGGRHEHVIGTSCGAWWSGPICYDGTPKGFAVYEVDGESVSWRYQSAGRPADHQMRLYPRGADPSAPDEVVANVWDADPDWTVVWYENGERKGRMARRLGTDPLSERLHRGADQPDKRSWVEPVPTAHLYYAPVSADASTVRVVATDRFGRTYTDTIDPSAPVDDISDAVTSPASDRMQN